MMIDSIFSRPQNYLRIAPKTGTSIPKLLGAAVLCVLALLTAAPGCAQLMTTATINGAVTDPTGAVVPNTIVEVTSDQTRINTQTTTNGAGVFVVPGLTVGTYTVVFRKDGFETYAVHGVVLHPATVSTVNASLSPGKVSSSVTVQATSVQVETSTPELSSEVSEEQAATLPLNGRNFQSMSALMPGVTNTTAGTSLGQGGFLTSNAMSINGMSVSGTMYYLDGIWNMNSGNMTQTTVTPNPDTIEEIRVLQNNYSVQYNLNGASVVLLQTRSGTSEFHGGAYEYLRNTDVDARNYFSTTVSPLQQNIFGYTVGGPAYIPHFLNATRSKTFFFWSQQWVRQLAGQTLLGVVPTADERQGQFSGTVKNPATGQNFPKNSSGMTQIGPLNSASVALMNAIIPQPNNPTGGVNNYINQTPQIDDQRDDEIKLDEAITKNTHLMGELLHSGQSVLYANESLLGSPLGTTRTSRITPNYLAQIQLSHIFSSSMVNSTAVALNRYLTSEADTGVYQESQVPGFQQGLPYSPAIATNLLPEITFAQGFSAVGLAGGNPQIGANDVELTASDDWSWLRGHHYIQAGVQLLWGSKHQTSNGAANGLWNFSGYATGNALADFLLGDAATLAQANNRPRFFLHYVIYSPYIEDSWHATQRLTVTAGLRYQYMPNLHPQSQFESVFEPSLYSATKAPIVNNSGTITPTANYSPQNGFAINGANGVPLNFASGHPNNLAPEAGFAYDVFGDGKTSLRGGYGITYYSDLASNCGNACSTNPPFVQSITLVDPNFPNSVGAGVKPAGAGTITSEDLGTLRPPMIQSFSLSAQHEFGGGWIASFAGAGNMAHHVPWVLNINQPAPDGAYSYNPAINTGTQFTYLNAPYLGYAAINQTYYEAYANWHAFEANMRHSGKDLFLSVAYTWQHALTNENNAKNLFSGPAAVQNTYNPQAEYGNGGSANVPQVLTVSTIWSLPWLLNNNNWRNRVLGGWKISDMTSVQSGGSLTPSLSTSTKGISTRPNRVAGNINGPKTVAEWFNTAAFLAPAAGYFGNATPGSIQGPGLIDFDAAFYKDFHTSERTKFQFRAELFNILNHTNFSGVQTALGSANFGNVTSAADPRIAEGVLRFEF
jgi:hypothetical protein